MNRQLSKLIDAAPDDIQVVDPYVEDEGDDEDGDELGAVLTDEGTAASSTRWKVFYTSKDWTVSSLKEFHDKGTITAQPDYQRENVWASKPRIKSRLIESLLLNIPIPPLYLGQLSNGKFEVIDGQQRLTTILDFVDKEKTFKLQNLTKLKHLNGKTFQELNEADQDQIYSNTDMRTIVIDVSRDDDLRYQIFERLNRGSVHLYEQEIRNCIYRGPFNDLLRKLINDPVWRKIVRFDKPMEHYKEQEHALRFLALAKQMDSYKSSLKSFMNTFMWQHKALPADSPVLKGFEQLFHQTMQNVYDVFGDGAARLYGPAKGETRDNEGGWYPDFSILALEIQASALLGHDRIKVQAIADQIREAYLRYLLTNKSIQEAISKSTSKNIHVKLRWTGFKAEVNNLLMSAGDNPRFFSSQFRRRLFEESPTCCLCDNQIHSLEDSTVDHITAWANEGRTVPDNGQLAHRLCNASKNAS